MRLSFRLACSFSLACCLGAAWSMPPVTIVDQGSFAAGGTVIEAKSAYDPYHPKAQAQTLHGDHAIVSYQVPAQARTMPLVFLHGAGQSSKTWDTTPDGRDGFKNIFLADGYPVYLVDQPRRGNAGRSTVAGQIAAAPDEGFFFGQFRMGLWPKFNVGSAFPQDAKSLDQFFRQMTPNTAPYDVKVNADALSAVFEKTGDAVFVMHSQGCGIGWLVGMQSAHVKGIVAYEPGSGFPFPKGEVPAPIKNAGFFGDMKAEEVPMDAFLKLTHFPIVIFYGDYIPKTPTRHRHNDYWRAASEMADLFAAAVNRHGGDAKVIRLPDIGIRGNSHFPFAERNNQKVAKALKDWLSEKKLDGCHQTM